MQLNTIKPSEGAKHAKRSVGRGIGSGLGKTAGRGHKGQKSRTCGYHKVGVEVAQMPLQRGSANTSGSMPRVIRHPSANHRGSETEAGFFEEKKNMKTRTVITLILTLIASFIFSACSRKPTASSTS